jgi:hypothetical protein
MADSSANHTVDTDWLFGDLLVNADWLRNHSGMTEAGWLNATNKQWMLIADNYKRMKDPKLAYNKVIVGC